jgi:hypothetical protein
MQKYATMPPEVTMLPQPRGPYVTIIPHLLEKPRTDKQTLVEEIAAWQHDRNANHTKANWQFSTPNARIKLKHLYPAI